jgi:hypothetical protein
MAVAHHSPAAATVILDGLVAGFASTAAFILEPALTLPLGVVAFVTQGSVMFAIPAL